MFAMGELLSGLYFSESRLERARKTTRRVWERYPIPVTLGTIALDGCVGVGAFLLADSLDGGLRILAAFGAACMGSLAALGLVFIWALASARRHQKEERLVFVSTLASQAYEALFGDEDQMRPKLQEILAEVREGARRINHAIETGNYWRMREGTLPSDEWKAAKAALSRHPEFQALYSVLLEAYQHVERLNTTRAAAIFGGSRVRDADDLSGALAALEQASGRLARELQELEA